jgi:uncharacterized damage-inducible protein DinB
MATHRIEEYRELYAFNRWANQQILQAVGALPRDQFERDMGSSFRSVRDTLVHIMSAEWVWLARWNGSSPTAVPADWVDHGLARIEEGWAMLDAELQRFVEALQEPDLDRLIAYRNIAGTPFSTPLSQMLRHVVNHSSFHRGQVVTMLRQLGAAAPATDLIVFCRRRSESAPAG